MSTTTATKANHYRHWRYGKGFAANFVERLLSWSSGKHTISASMYVGRDDGLTAFVFTLNQPSLFYRTRDGETAAQLAQQAVDAVPTCKPFDGDLSVFVGRRILMFKRFNESVSAAAAAKAADEVASYILWKKLER